MNDSLNLDCLLVKTKAVLLELIKTAPFLQDDDNIAYLDPQEVVSKQQIRTFFERNIQ